MANALYPKFKEALLAAGLNVSTGSIKAILVDTTTANKYTYSAAHSALTDVPAAARIAVSAALTTKTTALGVFGADDVTFSAVSGAAAGAVVVYDDTSGKLIAYIDTATGLPVTPNGGDITVSWDKGANRIFAL